MSATTHKHLLEIATKAVLAVASDQSVSLKTVKESLEEINIECEARIEAIDDDLRRTGE